MASTTQETHTMNTPQPYGGRDGGDSVRSTSGVSANASPAASTHGAGATAGATSKSNISSSRNQSQQTSPPSQDSRRESQDNTSRGMNAIQGGRKDTNGVAEPAEDEGGAARGSGTKAAEGGAPPPTEPEGGYPEQLHAGKLDGLGPEYGKTHKVTVGERAQGLKEELKGTVKRDPELKKTGKERMTGELKRKDQRADHNTDALQNAKDDKQDEKDKGASDPKSSRTHAENTDEPGLTEHPQASAT